MTDIDYLAACYDIAAESIDPSTQNAAILVLNNPKQTTVEDINRFPDWVNDRPEERWQRPLKYKYIEHAERNVIYQCARWGKSSLFATLYTPWIAGCFDCARAIIQAGITRVVAHDCALHKTHATWNDGTSLVDEMLSEANIQLVRLKHHFGKRIRFNGEEVTI